MTTTTTPVHACATCTADVDASRIVCPTCVRSILADAGQLPETPEQFGLLAELDLVAAGQVTVSGGPSSGHGELPTIKAAALHRALLRLIHDLAATAAGQPIPTASSPAALVQAVRRGTGRLSAHPATPELARRLSSAVDSASRLVGGTDAGFAMGLHAVIDPDGSWQLGPETSEQTVQCDGVIWGRMADQAAACARCGAVISTSWIADRLESELSGRWWTIAEAVQISTWLGLGLSRARAQQAIEAAVRRGTVQSAQLAGGEVGVSWAEVHELLQRVASRSRRVA